MSFVSCILTIDDYVTKRFAKAFQTSDDRLQCIGYFNNKHTQIDGAIVHDLTKHLCQGDTFRCQLRITPAGNLFTWEVLTADAVTHVPWSQSILGSLWVDQDYQEAGRLRAFVVSPFLDPTHMEQYEEKTIALLFDSRLPPNQLVTLGPGTNKTPTSRSESAEFWPPPAATPLPIPNADSALHSPCWTSRAPISTTPKS